MSQFKKILPLLNRVLVKRIEPETKTTSGIIINKTDSNVYGTIVESGPGYYDSEGKLIPVSVKVGDKVLLPEFNAQKVKLGEQELYIYRDTDIIAKLE
jgi:chaperonin GroES